MGRLLATLGFAFGLAQAALAQPQVLAQLPAGAVVISPGERVELTIGADGAPLLGARAPMSKADADAIPKLDNSYERVGQISVGGAPPMPGRLVFELLSDPAAGARLKALNGYDGPVIYSAALVLQREGRTVYVATSICPVLAGQVGLETWGDSVVGIAITAVQRADPAHLACNNGSVLGVPAQPAATRYVCVGGDRGPGPLPPFAVSLVVDAQGVVSGERASWTLSRTDILHSPAITFDFAMEGDHVAPGARSARVMAVVALQPPPTAKSADIVLLLDGTPVARRPWRMFAQNVAASPSDPSRRPVAFTGIVPFVPDQGDADAGLRRLLAIAGDRPGAIEARIVGDDGSVIADGSYDLAQAPIGEPAVVGAALRQALAAAKAPANCQRLGP